MLAYRQHPDLTSWTKESLLGGLACDFEPSRTALQRQISSIL